MGVEAVFHGFVSGARKREVLSSAAVMCVPSREVGRLSEGSPLVVSEATSLGIPVVATRVGGIPELAEDGALVTLVEPGDRAALRRALARYSCSKIVFGEGRFEGSAGTGPEGRIPGLRLNS